MARRNAAEIATGAVVLVVAAGFLAYAVAHSGRSAAGGYTLHASFDHIDGLPVGSDVRMAGVKIGSISAEVIDPKTYLANVAFTVADNIRLPKDSSAEITSESLLGGKYLSISPGGDEQMLADGGTVTITQSSVSLEQLLGKFIFSVTDMVNAVKGGNGGASAGGPGGSGTGNTGTGNTGAGSPGGGLGGPLGSAPSGSK
jgi:phospholipid/cholesterol/gamma-HCH transport system substrate-binding protein